MASRRFDPSPDPVAPAVASPCPEAVASSAVPAVPSPQSPHTPTPADVPAGRPTRGVRLADLGDVLTDADLAALLQRAPSWPRRERDRARAARVAPNLPRPMDIPGRPRYRKVDVEHWLRTGSSTRPSLRRVG